MEDKGVRAFGGDVEGDMVGEDGALGVVSSVLEINVLELDVGPGPEGFLGELNAFKDGVNAQVPNVAVCQGQGQTPIPAADVHDEVAVTAEAMLVEIVHGGKTGVVHVLWLEHMSLWLFRQDGQPFFTRTPERG